MDSDFIEPTTLRFVLLGGGPVGKTEICNAFKDKEIGSNIPSEIIKTIKLKNNENINIHLTDTTGQEKFMSMVISMARGFDGIILVFDVTSKYSFDNLDIWLNKIKEYIKKSFYSFIWE